MSNNNDAAIALLEKHFDIAFAAPDGIKKLRKLILSLAMQGKLVPQDPSDQPASELLKEIEVEKNRLVKEGKIKQSKPLPEIESDELPYDVPKSWEWVRLATIGEINPRNTCEDDMDAGFVPMPLIFAGYRSLHKFEIRKWSEIKKGYTHFADGDVALAKITPCFENGKSCVFDGLPNGIGAGTTELHVFRNTFNCIYSNYLFAYFKTSKYLALGASKMTGSAGQKRVPTDFFSLNPFPLPPLSEQRRIVAKIDELMARCDELEKQRSDRDRKQITVHTAALNRLLIAKEQSNFNTAWQFITQHFGELYSVKENVTELRKAILQLAVMGKLVPQDPNDQPASELLKEIEEGKKSLVKEGKVKGLKPLALRDYEKLPFKLPSSWIWTSIERLCETIVDCPHSTPQFVLNGIICIDTNSFKGGKIINHKLRYVSKETYTDRVKRLSPQVDDVIFAREGSVGESVIVPQGMVCCLGQRVMLFRPAYVITSRYLQLSISNQLFWARLLAFHKGIGAKHVNVKDMKNALISLPPLAEQHRIVAKIDQLMALCNNLEKQIDHANSKQTNLLNAVMTKI